jgi:hypothetical protein
LTRATTSRPNRVRRDRAFVGSVRGRTKPASQKRAAKTVRYERKTIEGKDNSAKPLTYAIDNGSTRKPRAVCAMFGSARFRW